MAKSINLSYHVPFEVTEGVYSESDEFTIQGIAINSTLTDNNHKFLPDELKSSVHSLINRPLLKDHSNKVDSIVGSIIRAEYSESEKNIQFKARINNTEQGKKVKELIKAGDLKTVSIGANVRELEESEDGTFIPRGIMFKELSLVAVPADDNAKFVFRGNSFSSALREAIDQDEDENEEEEELEEKQFTCKECGKMFKTKEELDKHYEKSHPKTGQSQSSDLIAGLNINKKEEYMEKDEIKESVDYGRQISELDSKFNTLSETLKSQTDILAETLKELKAVKESKTEEAEKQPEVKEEVKQEIVEKTVEKKKKKKKSAYSSEEEDSTEQSDYKIVQEHRSFTVLRNKY